jgi:phospholipid/cholesterol/gamma-HCH transport system substrate-binding protein
LVGQLLIDERYGKETGDSIRMALHSVQNVFAKIDSDLQSNSGVISALLQDPEGKKKVYQLLDNLSVASASLGKVVQQLEKGEGTIPLLLHDDRTGKEITRNLREFSDRLNSIGRKLDEGTGTAGKLINDPAIFDAANRLVVGVDESAILRWLIKDRQKSGIKKEYHDVLTATALPLMAYTPTPTPQ